jgi:phosphatidylserine/phosphatidylglycerophosphate/cardiolipin synthase-like enzyme
MMFQFKSSYRKDNVSLLSSKLYNEQSFYPAFIADARRATESIIIESPFITYRRLMYLHPTLKTALRRGVTITINTRNPKFHEGIMKQCASRGITLLQDMGIEVLYTSKHHRKLAIVDRKILYEGSLNILSQSDSCEVMRRIESTGLAEQMIRFIGLGRWYTK